MSDERNLYIPGNTFTPPLRDDDPRIERTDPRIEPSDIKTCREPSCGAKIFFAETPSKRTCPLDLEPNPEGEYVLDGWGIKYRHGRKGPRYFLARVGNPDEGEPRYISHFKTCTRASQFSRKGKA